MCMPDDCIEENSGFKITLLSARCLPCDGDDIFRSVSIPELRNKGTELNA